MKCTECGGDLGPAVPGEWPYRSLPGTTLVGIPIRTCESCGDQVVSIPRIEELDRVLAKAVAERPGRLSGPEIRFLRRHLGWSGADFAGFFRTSPATVSRWETGKQNMDARAEQLLRVSATRMEPILDYAEYERLLRRMAESVASAAPPTRALRWQGSWEAAA